MEATAAVPLGGRSARKCLASIVTAIIWCVTARIRADIAVPRDTQSGTARRGRPLPKLEKRRLVRRGAVVVAVVAEAIEAVGAIEAEEAVVNTLNSEHCSQSKLRAMQIC